MNYRKLVFLVLLAMGLAACDGAPSIAPEGEFQPLVGEWIYFTQKGKLGSSDYVSDRRYLRVGADGTTLMASCYLSRSGATSVRTSIDPAPGRITRLDNSGFIVRVSVPKLDVVGIDFEYRMAAAPVEQNGRWIMKVDDVAWLKRREGEADPMDDWSCPEP